MEGPSKRRRLLPRQPGPRAQALAASGWRGPTAEAARHWALVGCALGLACAAALAKEIGITTVRAPTDLILIRHTHPSISLPCEI